MMYKGNTPIDAMYVGSKLVQQAYIGNKKIYPENGQIPSSIKDAMVLWYDVKRQGCTNADMASNAVLSDLSGNGNDATCTNFAWTEESGVGTANYPNAIVLDGVDDYVASPTLSTENGSWTVMFKTEWLGEEDYNTGIYIPSLFHIYNQGADGNLAIYIDNDTASTNVPVTAYAVCSDDNIYCTDGSVYTNTNEHTNTGTKSGQLTIGSNSTLSEFAPLALYSVLLFNKELSAEEIKWVKKNLIDGD